MFQKESFRKNIKTNHDNDKIRDKRVQQDINRQAAKMSALPSGKIDQYEFLIGEEILLSDPSRIME